MLQRQDTVVFIGRLIIELTGFRLKNKYDTSMELLRGNISNFRIIYFPSFSFLSRLRFPTCPRFDITQVKC